MISAHWLAKFWQRVQISERCWMWIGAKLGNGYGSFTHRTQGKSQTLRAHRLSWELHFGVIPNGLWVLHHCDQKLCVNPRHLFLGTNSTNQLDAVKKGRHYLASKTHCPQGHPYDAQNTYIVVDHYRRCKMCRALRDARRYDKRRERWHEQTKGKDER